MDISLGYNAKILSKNKLVIDKLDRIISGVTPREIRSEIVEKPHEYIIEPSGL